MDNDKILFQRAAQGLIIYDNENRDAYRKGWYDIEYCPKGFCAHRIILCVILGLNILTVMVSRIIAVDMNFVLAVIFLLLYKRYRKKAKLKKEALENRSEILNNDRRKRYIDTLNQLSAKHPEWNVEPWWNTVCGLELDIGNWYNYDLHY